MAGRGWRPPLEARHNRSRRFHDPQPRRDPPRVREDLPWGVLLSTSGGEAKVPGDPGADYTEEQAVRRRAFVAEVTGARLEHVGSYSLDPGSLPGNIENFTGVAQVPIGVAGPLRVDGGHARGDFYIPLATTVGTLAAREAVGPLRSLRFDCSTGDAAGQNLTGKATFAACQWIRANQGRNR